MFEVVLALQADFDSLYQDPVIVRAHPQVVGAAKNRSASVWLLSYGQLECQQAALILGDIALIPIGAPASAGAVAAATLSRCRDSRGRPPMPCGLAHYDRI